MVTLAAACKNSETNMLVRSMDNGKYVRYTPEQVEALERLYTECPKPSSMRRQQLIRDCPILSNIELKQIKVWFQNRRCREKQRKESSRLQTVNRKLAAMNKLLMEENDRLQKQVSELVYENGYFRQQTQNSNMAATTDTSCESVVTSGQHHLPPPHPPRDASPAGLMSIAEETLTEFLSKATGTAIEWVQMPGMKPGPDFIGIVAISHSCSGVAARACGLVSLEPSRVSDIVKDKPSWLDECRSVEILNSMSTVNGGTIELLYMQLYSPTTLAPPRDFYLLRYTCVLEDGSLVICERSLINIQNGPSVAHSQHFVRAEMLPSGCLIRPCEGGGSIIHIVDHFDFESRSVPEVVRPLYEFSTLVAQKMTTAALRHLRQISQEVSLSNVGGWGRRPVALRALSQRLSRGFNEAVNGVPDNGWSTLESDGIDDVTILVNSYTGGFPSTPTAVLCAKTSMLLQNVSPSMIIRFLREHRSEWAESGIKSNPCNFTSCGAVGSQVVLPFAQTTENEEFLEVLKLENMNCSDNFLLQLCRGLDETGVFMSSELIFAPIDASLSEDVPIIPSGFRIIPLESKPNTITNRTLDLASALEVGPTKPNYLSGNCRSSMKSVMTMAFQFTYEIQMQESFASVARQFVRSIISSVQRVSLALSPARPASPNVHFKARTLAHWICQSYKCYLGVDLVKNGTNDSPLKSLWHHSDSIICCTLKPLPVLTFANQAGLDMLETTMVALQDITLEKIFDENGHKLLCSEFPKIIHQGFMCLEEGICFSSRKRPVTYERSVAWKVANEDDDANCICFMFVNWSFV